MRKALPPVRGIQAPPPRLTLPGRVWLGLWLLLPVCAMLALVEKLVRLILA